MALLKFFYYLGSIVISTVMTIKLVEENKKVKTVAVSFSCVFFVVFSFVLDFSLAALIACVLSIFAIIVYKKNFKFLISLLLAIIIECVFVFFISDFFKVYNAIDELFYFYSYFFALSVFAILLLLCKNLDFNYMLFVDMKKEICKYFIAEAVVFANLLLLLKSFKVNNFFDFSIKYSNTTLLIIAVISLIVIYHSYQSEKVFFTKEVENRQESKAYMNIIRSQRHDYNLHVQTIASLIKQKKWDECCNYVNALVDDTNVMNKVLPVENTAIAALINNYRIMCSQQGFELEIDIRDNLSTLLTNEYESNKIIGNLLQNAYDETIKLTDKSYGVKLEAFKRGEFVLIKVSNKVANANKFAESKEELFRQGFTTKVGHDGVGLSSISMVLKKYNGEVYVWLEDDIVHFVANIPIRLQ